MAEKRAAAIDSTPPPESALFQTAALQREFCRNDRRDVLDQQSE
jgi:hypothetical protein